MPTNIDALYKMATHGSKKVKWWTGGVQVLESKKSPKTIYKKWLCLKHVYHHFIEEIGRGIQKASKSSVDMLRHWVPEERTTTHQTFYI